MRLTLIYPSVGRKAGKPYVRAWQMQPLSMALLAGITPPDVEVRFYDDRMEEIPFDEPTDLVAISVETFTALRAYKIARQFRARGVPVVMGGYHVTLVPDEAQLEADAIVLGDAEPIWERLLDDARRGDLQAIYRGLGRRELRDVRPRREIFAGRKYQNITLVEFARGCNFKCDFCAITAFHNANQNHRPADEVAAEMAGTLSRRFFIVDDNIVSQPAKVRELCRVLAPLGINWVGQASIHVAGDDELLELMVASGCRGVLIGMESLDPENLRDMGKDWNLAGGSYAESLARFRKHGLATYGTFVFGYDNDDRGSIQRSIDFAREQKLFLAAFNHLIPFPGTPLYRRLESEGRLLKQKWWLDPEGRVGEVVFQPKKMTPAELEEHCLDARRQFYGWGSIVERLRDRRANASSLLMAGVYLGLNLSAHYDIDLRHGLRLGAGLTESPPLVQTDPIYIQYGVAGAGGIAEAPERRQPGLPCGPAPATRRSSWTAKPASPNGNPSMTRFRFELATEADDADLRRILAETPMPGQIAVSFRREPSYFAAAVVEGDFRQVVAARDSASGRIVGFGSRSIRRRYVNGHLQPIGYLGNLRLLPEHRNRGLVARGYRFFRKLHADGRTPFYLTTIAAGNETAIRLLTSGRAGLPIYHDAGEFHTLAIPLSRRRREPTIPAGLTIRPATSDDLPAILTFLAEHGPARQFFPDHKADDFFGSTGTFRDLRPDDLLLAFRAGRIVGTLGAWDQHGFRQSVVQGYSGAMRWSRPLYNGLARLRGRPKLPQPGQPFRYLIGALPIVVNDDATIFLPLLEMLLAAAAGRSADYLLLGLHADDRLLPVVHPYRTKTYATRLYQVCWYDGEELRTELDARPPFLELGCL